VQRIPMRDRVQRPGSHRNSMCTDNHIKELLPAYLEEALQQQEKLLVEEHLGSCGDCRVEVAILRSMAGETVPDPGEAFWATMPDRVYRAVREQSARQKPFDLDRLMDWIAVPRWAWAAAAFGLLLVISWYILLPLKTEQGSVLSQGYELSEETIVAGSVDTLNPELAELDQNELGGMENWANRELASIALEAEPVVRHGHDPDIYEELAELDMQEIERLSKMLDHLKEEG
jgi:hypothetical protein